MIGVSVGNPAGTVMVRALVAMFVCWFIGMLVGSLAQHAVDGEIEKYKQRRPLPSGNPDDDEDEESDEPGESEPGGSEQQAAVKPAET